MDAVLLPPAAPVIDRERHANPAVLGLLIGAAVPALVASAAWWLGMPWVAAVAGVGVVLGAVFGAGLSQRMLGPDWIGMTLLGALAAPLVPGGLIAVAFALSSVAAAGAGSVDLVSGVVYGIVLGVIALVVAELGGAPITVPVAFVVAALVRRAARMPAHGAVVHVGALVLAAAGIGLVTIVAIAGLLVPLGIGRIDPGY